MDPFLGEIKMFGFGWNPMNWALCDGKLIPVAQYTALFSLLGDTFGGDGRNTFALPDLQGRVPRGQGTGPGLSTVQMGEKAGSETKTLTVQEMPSHSHHAQTTPVDVQVSTTVADKAEPAAGDYLGVVSSGGRAAPTYLAPEDKGTTVALGGVSGGSVQVENAGAGLGFSTMNPFLGMNFSIALQGIYPSRP